MHQDRRGYWYRTSRSGGCVVREYMGRGEVAALGARLEELDAQEREEERRLERARLEAAQAQARAEDEPVERLCVDVERVLRQVLEGAGYHLHARSQWRKRRTDTMSKGTTSTERGTAATDAATDAAKGTAADTSPALRALSDAQLLAMPTLAELKALQDQAHTDEAAARRFVDLMEMADKPSEPRGYLRKRDIAAIAEHSMLQAYGSGDKLAAEIGRRRFETMRLELAGPNPTPLEEMLVERVALCWFHVHLCEVTLAQRQTEMTLAVAEYQQKRLDRAHKRHLSAIKALAQVRKMALPAPPVLVVGQVTGPVNVGGHQVNVATTGQAENKAQSKASSTAAHDPEALRRERTTKPRAGRSGLGR